MRRFQPAALIATRPAARDLLAEAAVQLGDPLNGRGFGGGGVVDVPVPGYESDGDADVFVLYDSALYENGKELVTSGVIHDYGS